MTPSGTVCLGIRERAAPYERYGPANGCGQCRRPDEDPGARAGLRRAGDRSTAGDDAAGTAAAGRQTAARRAVAPDVAEEIEEFMRRAANRRNVQGTQPAPAPPPTPAAAEPARAQVGVEQPVGGQVEEHVKKYLDAQEFSRRSQELGEEVAEVDREVGQHLHEVFDHQVSRLEVVPGEAAAPPEAAEPSDLAEASPNMPATFATGLLDLVSSPDSLRQAIILNEILHRPEERWER